MCIMEREVLEHFTVADVHCATCALQLIFIRDGTFALDGFSFEEVKNMIAALLTN